MCRVLNILLAVLSRVLFALHGLAMVYYVVTVKNMNCLWLLLMGVALLGVELIITIKYTRNTEWKWFSPTVFLYLSTVIPCIWFLELELLKSRQPPQSTPPPFLLEKQKFVAGLEQTMIIVLVLGRWLMPKGDMSHDQLSQLLMVYVSLGADILDIFGNFKEPEVNCTLIIVGLSLFSWALMQFTFVLTQTNHPKPQLNLHLKTTTPYTSCCSSEIWSLLLTVGLQDGPFLVYRLYLMVGLHVLNHEIIFFTCKNILTVMLELYRIGVVYFKLHRPRGRERSSDEPQRQTENVLESSHQGVN